MLKVENHVDLLKDPHSGAVINKNTDGYMEYMAAVRKRKEAEESTKNEMVNLKNQIASLQSMVEQLINKGNE